jgi:hypothetical protein
VEFRFGEIAPLERYRRSGLRGHPSFASGPRAGTRWVSEPSQGFGNRFRRFIVGIRRNCARTSCQFRVLFPMLRPILRTHAATSFSTWCSQIRRTFQPRRWSFPWFLWSRSRLPEILSRQKVGSLWRQIGKRHPCQKSPLTKTATFAFGKTKSGRPGRVRSCCRNLRPPALSNDRIYRSGVVFFPLILDITRLRCSGDMMSTTDGHPPLQAKWFSPQA